MPGGAELDNYSSGFFVMHNLYWLKLGCSHCISTYSAFACLGLAAWQLQLQLTRLPAFPGNVMVITCRAVLYPTACSSLSCLKRLHLDLLAVPALPPL
jgi:hypothetical protein